MLTAGIVRRYLQAHLKDRGFRPSWLLQRIAAKEKNHEELHLDQEDMDLLVEIREAYSKHLREKAQEERQKQNELKYRMEPAKKDIHFASWKHADSEDSSPPRWEEFLEAKYDGGHKKVKNTSPKTKDMYPEVSVTTLMKTDKAFMKRIMEEYDRWSKGPGEDEDSSNPSGSATPFGVTYPKEYKIGEVSRSAKDAIKELGLSPKDIVDLSGLGGADEPLVDIEISMKNGILVFEGYGSSEDSKIIRIIREIDFKEKTMQMEHMELDKDAPKGTGTKILASQIEKAKLLGLKTLTCTAGRKDPRIYGYKVWPRMGYDGPIPVEKTGLPKKFQDALTNAGHQQPWRIQQLYGLGKDAIDWWDEHGTTFEAEFDLNDDSTSMKLFGAYVKSKGGYDQLVAS